MAEGLAGLVLSDSDFLWDSADSGDRLVFVAIIMILIAAQSASGRDSRSDRSGGGMVFFPSFWISPNWFWIFSPDPYRYPATRRRPAQEQSSEAPMNFLEAIFSFLFGDGNPNADLEERRWRTIAAVIRNHQGAVTAEQIAPYLDLDAVAGQTDEDYMLPVLSRFDGRPQVSPEGGIIYFFPELQVTTRDRGRQSVPTYLQESPWRFSRASSGQKILAIALGASLLILGAIFWNLQYQPVAASLGFVVFVQSIFWLLMGYGIGFLTIPLVRYFWIQNRNQRIQARNQQRQENAQRLRQPSPELQQKLAFARRYATQTVVREADLAYTTEKDLLEQEIERSEEIDAEWRRRLNQSSSES